MKTENYAKEYRREIQKMLKDVQDERFLSIIYTIFLKHRYLKEENKAQRQRAGKEAYP